MAKVLETSGTTQLYVPWVFFLLPDWMLEKVATQKPQPAKTKNNN
jgi:hypothetical protein